MNLRETQRSYQSYRTSKLSIKVRKIISENFMSEKIDSLSVLLQLQPAKFRPIMAV